MLRVCVLCMLLMASPFASAQWRTSQDAEICITGTGVRSLDVAVCGRALGREDLSSLDRASVLTARGRAYRDTGNLSAARADFDAALALNPYSANAFHERALTLEKGDHHEQALEDFQRALALSPRFAAAYKSRGVAYFYAASFVCAHVDFEAAAALAPGDAEVHAFRGFLSFQAGRYRDAAGDFERARVLGLPYPYLPLWRYLAAAGSGAPALEVLHEARAELLPGEWPQPLVDVYLGALENEALIASLESQGDSPAGRRRMAASHYYLAALDLLEGRSDQARPHLEKALTLSQHRSPERAMAEHELAAAGGAQPSRLPSGC